MEYDFRVRCPIHGFIRLSLEERDVIDLDVFQRLRRIKQLAFTDLVYPGAVHTRFEHSLGVCHLAGELGSALKLDEDTKKRLRMTGLIHDIGHPPFSHVGEEALNLFSSKENIESRMGDNHNSSIHEIIAVDLIQNASVFNEVFRSSRRDEICRLLEDWKGEPFEKDIISGPMDIDKQDYLLRDSYYCGVKYGVFDLQQLQRETRTISDNRSAYLGISEDGIHSLEQFVLAKFYISGQVYTHRVRLITDQMLLRAIKLGIEHDKIGELISLFSYKNSDDFLNNYISWDDHNFLLQFTKDIYRDCSYWKLLKRIIERKLYKQIFHLDLDNENISPETRKALSNLSKPENLNFRNKVEQNIFGRLAEIEDLKMSEGFGDASYLIAHSYSKTDIKNQTISSAGEILVESREKPTQFSTESILFRSMKKSFNQIYFDVYAPIEYEQYEKRNVLQKAEKAIMDLLAEQSFNEGSANG